MLLESGVGNCADGEVHQERLLETMRRVAVREGAAAKTSSTVAPDIIVGGSGDDLLYGDAGEDDISGARHSPLMCC